MKKQIDIMSHKIMSMDDEKRERILNAVMAEFCNGFKSASTDKIVKEAGISKGLLFHYFGTKEGVYEYAVWYAFDLIVKEYFDLINSSTRDILERIWQMTLLKLDLSYKYPAAFDFITAAYVNSRGDSADEFGEMFRDMQKKVGVLAYGNIDTTLFKEGVDVEKTINIIMWTLTGYADTKIGKSMKVEDYRREYDGYLDDMKEYFDIFRSAFYK